MVVISHIALVKQPINSRTVERIVFYVAAAAQALCLARRHSLPDIFIIYTRYYGGGNHLHYNMT